jgi:hypothetical protein
MRASWWSDYEGRKAVRQTFFHIAALGGPNRPRLKTAGAPASPKGGMEESGQQPGGSGQWTARRPRESPRRQVGTTRDENALGGKRFSLSHRLGEGRGEGRGIFREIQGGTAGPGAGPAARTEHGGEEGKAETGKAENWNGDGGKLNLGPRSSHGRFYLRRTRRRESRSNQTWPAAALSSQMSSIPARVMKSNGWMSPVWGARPPRAQDRAPPPDPARLPPRAGRNDNGIAPILASGNLTSDRNDAV